MPSPLAYIKNYGQLTIIYSPAFSASSWLIDRMTPLGRISSGIAALGMFAFLT